MLHVIGITALITSIVAYPAGIWTWWRFGPTLRADAQKVVTEVTKFAGKAKVSEK